jgi:c-di-GMP-binding flagellar brake protein YcgR
MSPLEKTSANNVKIQLWEKLELECGKNDNTGIYFARVQDLSNGGILIDRPIWLSGEPTFNPDEYFLVTVMREDGAYRFNGRIIKSYKKGDKQFYVIKHPDKLYRHQRRGYVRVEIDMNVHFKLLNDVLDSKISLEESKEYVACSINLSASGILINSLKVLDKGDMVALYLKEKSLRMEYPVFGIVRRIVDAENNRIQAGIEFITAEELEKQFDAEQLKRLPDSIFSFTDRRRQALVQFVFNYQIKLRQKGLI